MSFEDSTNGTHNIESEDPYKRLGVIRGADMETIEKAYRHLAMKYHPDKGGDSVAMKRLNDARQKLKNNLESEKVSDPSEASRKPQEKETAETNAESPDKFEHTYPNESSPIFHAAKIKRKEPINRKRYIDDIDIEVIYFMRQENREAEGKGELPPKPEVDEETFTEYIKREMKGEIREKNQDKETDRSNSRRFSDRHTRERKQSETYSEKPFQGSDHSSYENKKEKIPLTKGLFKEKTVLNQWVVVDVNGSRLSKGYENIEVLGSSVIGINIFKQKHVLNPQSGQEAGQGYKSIRLLNNMLIAKDAINYERVIDQNTGKELSKRYETIKLVNGVLHGKTSYGESEALSF